MDSSRSEKLHAAGRIVFGSLVLWPAEVLSAAWVINSFVWWGMEFKMILLALIIFTVARIYGHVFSIQDLKTAYQEKEKFSETQRWAWLTTKTMVRFRAILPIPAHLEAGVRGPLDGCQVIEGFGVQLTGEGQPGVPDAGDHVHPATPAHRHRVLL